MTANRNIESKSLVRTSMNISFRVWPSPFSNTSSWSYLRRLSKLACITDTKPIMNPSPPEMTRPAKKVLVNISVCCCSPRQRDTISKYEDLKDLETRTPAASRKEHFNPKSELFKPSAFETVTTPYTCPTRISSMVEGNTFMIVDPSK